MGGGEAGRRGGEAGRRGGEAGRRGGEAGRRGGEAGKGGGKVPAAIGVEAVNSVPALCTTDPPCEYPDRITLVLGHCCSACCASETIREPPLPPPLALP